MHLIFVGHGIQENYLTFNNFNLPSFVHFHRKVYMFTPTSHGIFNKIATVF